MNLVGCLEVAAQAGEAVDFEQELRGDGLLDLVVFEDPGVGVVDKDGMKSGGEGWIDVGTRAVADHPCLLRVERVFADDVAIGVDVFLRWHFNGSEMLLDAGALEFVELLFGVAFGGEDDGVAFGEAGEGFGNAGEQFYFLLGDGAGEADDLLRLAVIRWGAVDFLIAAQEGLFEAGQAVAGEADGFVLALVEDGADFFDGVGFVIEQGDKRCDGPLEIDIVLPQGVVGVDEQGLGRSPGRVFHARRHTSA